MHRRRSEPQRREGPTSELEPVRILTPELLLQGFVASTGQRITDILLRGEGLPFLPAGADPAPDNWLPVAADDILAVIPPPLGSPPLTPAPLILRRAFADTGPYSITGTAHLLSEETLDEAFRTRQPFLPLTRATITQPDGHSEDVAVVIVNLDNCLKFGVTA